VVYKRVYISKFNTHGSLSRSTQLPTCRLVELTLNPSRSHWQLSVCLRYLADGLMYINIYRGFALSAFSLCRCLRSSDLRFSFPPAACGFAADGYDCYVTLGKVSPLANHLRTSSSQLIGTSSLTLAFVDEPEGSMMSTPYKMVLCGSIGAHHFLAHPLCCTPSLYYGIPGACCGRFHCYRTSHSSTTMALSDEEYCHFKLGLLARTRKPFSWYQRNPMDGQRYNQTLALL